MKTHEEGDQPVRYMANHYAGEIIKEATGLLLELARKDSDDWRMEAKILQIHMLLERVRFNLQKPKPK